MRSASDLLDDSALIADRYAVRWRLAESANGTVFLAEDTANSSRGCVIKQLSPTQKGAYLREVAAAMDLSHPRILSPIDTFYLGESHGCLVYEYLPEGTLRDWVRRNQGSIPLGSVEQCMRDLLGALQHLHRNNRIHCDIKPENIFVRIQGDSQEFLLGDLGATCSIREASEGRHRTGSPAYTAPERFYDKFDAASDFYSLGVVCFELLVGELPFTGSPTEISRAHLQKPVPVERIGNQRMRDFCAGLLEKDPARRVRSVEVALSLLNSPDSAPAQNLNSGSALSTRIATESQHVVRREKLQEILRGSTGQLVKDMLLLCIDQKPMLLFDHGEHLKVFHPNPQRSGAVIAKSGKVTSVSSRQIVYVLESRLMLLDMESGERSTLVDSCAGVLEYHLYWPTIAWRSRRSLHVMDLEHAIQRSHLAPHYLMEPCVAALGDGSVCLTSGPMNNELLFRGPDGSELRKLELDGPTLMMVGDRRSVLAVTLDVSRREHFSIWRASGFAAPEKITLESDVRRWACTPGHLFWLDGEDQIHQVGIGLSPRIVYKASEPVSQFAVSSDHGLLAILQPAEQDRSRVTVYST